MKTLPSRRAVRHARPKSQVLDGLESRRLFSTYTVTTNANTGAGSLRDAINNANLNPGADTIAFNLPAGSRTISITTALPAITGPTTIDGTTNPGYAGAPVIEITGNNVIIANALTINASNSVVRGLSMTGFARDVSFNFGRGVVLNGDNNLVEKNYFSLKSDGVSTLNLARYGVELNGANNTVRQNAGYAAQAFVGNDLNAANANSNVIVGNLMGTNASGMNLFSTSGMNYAVSLSAGTGNRIGGPTDAERNIIAIPAYAGIYINNNAGTTTVQNNFIGLNVSGSTALAFPSGATYGVQIGSGSGHLIRDNVIANAKDAQIAIALADGVQVHGNKIGLTFAGAPSGVGQRGVQVNGGETGMVTVGSTNAADRNWIMPGTVAGIDSNNAGPLHVVNNVIGLAPNGTASALSSSTGVRGYASSGEFFIQDNVIASTGQSTLIYLDTLGSGPNPGDFVRVTGNQLGMNLAGTAAVANAFSSIGILIGSTQGAIIANNKIAGVQTGINNTGDNYIRSNQFGLDASGLNPLAVGTAISATYGIIGGANAGEGNLIGDWTADAIDLVDGSGAVVRGNRIGTNVTGTATYTGSVGIRSSVSATIGGANPGDGNVITGATSAAIELHGGTHVVQGNTLGLQGRPNGVGVRLQANASNIVNSLIGGDTAGAANTIGFCTGRAIEMTQEGGNVISNVTVRRNTIHSNGGMAIDLKSDGVTANDALDVDAGVNGLQNFPVLLTADSTGGAQTAVSGFINTTASTPIVLDFYSADSAAWEARTWLGSKTIFTDAGGGATFTHTLPAVAGGKYIVATATNISSFPNGATSELSPGMVVTGPSDLTPPSISSGQFNFETGHSVKLFFTEDLQLGSIAAADLQMTNTTTNTSYTPSAFVYDSPNKAVTFYFASILPDGNYTYTLPAGTVSDPAGNATTATFSNTTFVLTGDANRDRSVNFNDLLVLAKNYNGSGKTFSQGNFNYDVAGAVNFNDLLLLAQRYNTSLVVAAPVKAQTFSERSIAGDILA